MVRLLHDKVQGKVPVIQIKDVNIVFTNISFLIIDLYLPNIVLC